MKKLALILVLAMAMPAMAAVTFSGDGAEGKLTISYTADPGDMPRGVALRVSLSDGATAGPADVESVMAEFNTNIDFAASNPGNFQVGDGHPLADPAAAGAITEAVSEFSISMGVLDEAGNQAPAPDGGPHVLIVINIGEACTATVCADTLRGPPSGVVGSVLESNLEDACIEVPIEVDSDCLCLPNAGEKTLCEQYEDAGYDMACWCTEFHCDGDAAGDKHILGYRIYTTDLNKIIDSWRAKMGDANLDPCADVGHDKHILGYLVYTTDLNILVANWRKKDADLPGDCPR
jgi:hypothetical protein